MHSFSRLKLIAAFLALLSLTVSMTLLMRTGTLAAGISFRPPTFPSSASPTPIGCGSWNLVSSPNIGTINNILNGVTAVSANDVWAVGSYGANPSHTLTEHWDGTSWNIVSSPNNGSNTNVLSAVSSVSTSDIWAVGYSYSGGFSQTLVENWNGSTWNVISSPSPATFGNVLYGVTAIAANDVWAVGYSQMSNGAQILIEHWDGTSWNVVSNPNPPPLGSYLYGVTAISMTNVWAVGTYSVNNLGVPQTLIVHWDGTSWSIVASPNNGSNNNYLFGVARIPGTTSVWAVGYYNIGSPSNNVYQALIEKWSGSQWKLVSSPSVGSSNNSLLGLAAVSKNNIWAVGFSVNGSYQPLIENWNGMAWNVIASPNPGSSANTLYGVARVPRTTKIWAVGSYITGSSSQTLTEFYC